MICKFMTLHRWHPYVATGRSDRGSWFVFLFLMLHESRGEELFIFIIFQQAVVLVYDVYREVSWQRNGSAEELIFFN